MELDGQGYVARPNWEAIRQGLRPPKPLVTEAGEWQHGLQYFASSAKEHFYLTTSLLSGRTAAQRAHLNGHSGPGAGAALSAAPLAQEFEIEPARLRVLIL